MIKEALTELSPLLDEVLDRTGVDEGVRSKSKDLALEVLFQLSGQGEDHDESLDVIEATADLLDDLLVLDVLVPGLAGKLLESKDGDAIELLLRKLAELVKPDPARRAERRARRDQRRSDRRARVASRRARRSDRRG